ncbi:MAG TPA: TauD/TfdA family dioxygenase [Stellaceae bacterium]|nr:TauD/TfdA family dioxygenase [Stellaceae bacterium]
MPDGMTAHATRHQNGWLGSEIDRNSVYWSFTPAHLTAIDECMEQVAKANIPFHQIRREHFTHPALNADLAAVLKQIKNGPGLLIMRGFPVDKYTAEEMQAVYWGIGTHFGHGCSQSADGDYLGHVTNVEKASRGYTTSRELTLHTDSAEIVGLLCVRDAREGGLSIYASSLKIHEIVEREHPEYLPVLERGFRCDRRGEEAPGDDPVTPYHVPVFSTRDGVLSCRYVRGVIDRGAETLGQPLSDLEKAALAFIDQVAMRDEVRFEVMLRPGEASFIDNYEMLHARTGFVDWDEPAKKRLLYRLWLEGEPPRPMVPETQLYRNRSGHMGVDPQPGRGPR